jgi:uncharacterized membrane protein YdjX (TVP38/TMEM64 family)
MNRRLMLLSLVGISVGMYVSGLYKYFTLTGIKDSLGDLLALQQRSPGLFAFSYFMAVLVSVAVSFPGAVMLALPAGPLFGVVWGTVLVSFSSSIGAWLAFLSARYLLRDWLTHHFNERLKRINQGVQREGALYLFTLRMVPIAPFFLINLLMGLTPMSSWRYYWISQVGLLAGTVVMVNAGKELARIDHLAELASPSLVASMLALGFFPWVLKRALACRQRVAVR